MGLFLQCQGQFGTFLYTDPTDNAVAAQNFATGDGSTTTLHLRARARRLSRAGRLGDERFPGHRRRRRAEFGLARSPTPNSLVFTTAPASGALIGASFAYAFQCRFDDDAADFEQFMQNLWTLQSLKFRSVRTARVGANGEWRIANGEQTLFATRCSPLAAPKERHEIRLPRARRLPQRRARQPRRADRVRRLLHLHAGDGNDPRLCQRRSAGRLQRPHVSRRRPAGAGAQVQGLGRARGRQAADHHRRAADRSRRRLAVPRTRCATAPSTARRCSAIACS